MTARAARWGVLALLALAGCDDPMSPAGQAGALTAPTVSEGGAPAVADMAAPSADQPGGAISAAGPGMSGTPSVAGSAPLPNVAGTTNGQMATGQSATSQTTAGQRTNGQSAAGHTNTGQSTPDQSATSATTPAAGSAAQPGVTAPGGTVTGPGAVATVNRAGVLTMALAEVLPTVSQRRDIARMKVTLSRPGAPERSADAMVIDLWKDPNRVEFAGVASGTYTLVVEGFNAQGTSLGQSTRVITVDGRIETVVAVRAFTIPNDGSGRTYDTSLVFGMELPGAEAPETLATYRLNPLTISLYADNAGHVLTRVPFEHSFRSLAFVQVLSTATGSVVANLGVSAHDGQPWPTATAIAYSPALRKTYLGIFNTPLCNEIPLEFSYGIECEWEDFSRNPGYLSIDGLAPDNLAVDAAGTPWYIRAGVVTRGSNDSVTPTSIPGLSAIVLDALGRLWVNHPNGQSPTTHELRRYDTGGARLGAYSLPFPVMRIVSDGTGGVWVSDRRGGQLAHIAADGTVGPALGVTAYDMCLDAQHRLWVATGISLLALDAEGREVRHLNVGAVNVAAGDGLIFARNSYIQMIKLAQ